MGDQTKEEEIYDLFVRNLRDELAKPAVSVEAMALAERFIKNGDLRPKVKKPITAITDIAAKGNRLPFVASG